MERIDAEDHEHVPATCPACGGHFPRVASLGQIVCENGHTCVYDLRRGLVAYVFGPDGVTEVFDQGR